MKQDWARKPETWTEFWHDFADMNRIIRTWKGAGISVGVSTNEKMFGLFTVFGYDLKSFPSCPYSFNIRTRFPVEHAWFFNLHQPLEDALLNEGFVTTCCRDGVEFSHQFHSGPGKVSFGIRASDEDAYLMYLRGDFGKMKLRELKREYNCNTDI